MTWHLLGGAVLYGVIKGIWRVWRGCHLCWGFGTVAAVDEDGARHDLPCPNQCPPKGLWR